MNRTELHEYIVRRQQELKQASASRKYETLRAGDSFPDHTLATAFQHFMRDVYSKAREARDKYNFPELGWATPDWQPELQAGIAEYLLKGDPRDVAVYAMFAWFHGWPTAPATPLAAGAAPVGVGLAAWNRLREAATPFAAHFREWMNEWPDEMESTSYPRHTFGQVRALHAALAATPAHQPVAGGAGNQNLARVLLKLAYRYDDLMGMIELSPDEDNQLAADAAQLAALVPTSVTRPAHGLLPAEIDTAVVEAEAFARLRSLEAGGAARICECCHGESAHADADACDGCNSVGIVWPGLPAAPQAQQKEGEPGC